MSALQRKVLRAIASADLPLPPPLPVKVPDLDADHIRNRVCVALQSLQLRGDIKEWSVLEVSRDAVSVRVQDSLPLQYEVFRFGLRELQELSVVLDVMES